MTSNIFRMRLTNHSYKVIVRGHNEDFTRDPKPATDPVKNNGFNPRWDKKFTFPIRVPDVAILELKVRML